MRPPDEEIGWLVLRSAAFTTREIPRFSIYRRLGEPQDQSGHEGVKKNLHPSDTRAVQPVAQRLAAWATWPLIVHWVSFKTHTHIQKHTHISQFRNCQCLFVFSLIAKRSWTDVNFAIQASRRENTSSKFCWLPLFKP